MYWLGSDVSGWGYALMTIGMLSFWALVIGAVVLLGRQLGRADQTHTVAPTPEELLAERFARGEIDEGEFTGRLTALHGRVRS